MVGRVDMLEVEHVKKHWKASGVDLSAILHAPPLPQHVARHCTQPQEHGLEHALDHGLVHIAQDSLKNRAPVKARFAIRNVQRTVGAMLSGEVARKFGAAGLPDDTISFGFTGSAGQSFGAFLARGITLTLEGEANDYVGKGLPGGRIIIYPPKNAGFAAEENILIGNVAFYGATSGEAFLNGMAGERFAVRNSGATLVVEGVGDHGCEYMTNGLVVVLGDTGRNFAAGMSGGLAYVLDVQGDFSEKRCNPGSVDLERVTESEYTEVLQRLISRHALLTGSKQASKILQNWQDLLSRFYKVFPHEYKRVLGVSRAKEGHDATQPAAFRAAVEQVQHG